VPATTLDHVPPRIMFPGKRRPAGLEVPACEPCNQGTKRQELMAAVFSRLSILDEPIGDQNEFKRLSARAHRAFPEWAAELALDAQPHSRLRAAFGDNAQRVRGVGVGKLTIDCMYTMGAKFGFAIHYDKTGVIVPPAGAVDVRFLTNLELLQKGMPSELFQDLGPRETLRQGEWHVGDYFNFRGGWIPDGSAGIYICMVGVAFATISFVVSDVSSWVEDEGRGHRFRPGDLQAKLATIVSGVEGC